MATVTSPPRRHLVDSIALPDEAPATFKSHFDTFPKVVGGEIVTS
jgi:hypothetical protein